MSLEMITWAMRLDLKGTRFQVMIALANEANSDGVVFTGTDKLLWYSNVSLRTFRTIIAEFRAEDLLHTERRYKDFGDGRECDTLVLHPWNKELFKPNYPGAAAARQVAKRSREKFEITTEEYGRKHTPTTDSTPSQPESAKLAPSKEVPSQTESAKLAPKERYMQNQAPLSAKPGAAECKNEQSAFNRNARAFNPLTQITQSVSPTPEASPAPAPQPMPTQTDRPTEPSKIVDGVNLVLLRQQIEARTATSLAGLPDAQLAHMVKVVLSRATQTPKSPLAFVTSSIATELPELVSATWAATTPENAENHSEPRLSFCQKHTREYTTPDCPLCLKEFYTPAAVTEEAPSPEELEAGRRFREQLRARRNHH